jgi:hypothetical protein
VSLSREELLLRRLDAHGLGARRFPDPAHVVRGLGAVQAQDLPGAMWAIAQRTDAPSRDAVAAALDGGDLLRGHALRPTWHIVAREDLRWIQAATGARVEQAVVTQYRTLALDQDEFALSDAAIAAVLRREGARTRAELTKALQDAGIDTADPVRVAHLLMHAEVTALITSGPARGRQQTYALVDERVRIPSAVPSDPLADLARRYLAGHGPASVQDLAWWSGMTVTSARDAITSIAADVRVDRFHGTDLWSIGAEPAAEGDRVVLLSNYDEFVVGYADRRMLFGDVVMADNPVFRNVILERGTIVGTWSPKADDLAPELFAPVPAASRRALAVGVERYREYAAG